MEPAVRKPDIQMFQSIITATTFSLSDIEEGRRLYPELFECDLQMIHKKASDPNGLEAFEIGWMKRYFIILTLFCLPDSEVRRRM